MSDLPVHEIRQLKEHITGLPGWRLHPHDDTDLTPAEKKELATLIERREHGEPLQYIIGEAPFRGLMLKVTPDVLIPRFDTESVAGEAIVIAKTLDAPLVLDLGTGSGAIALSIADEAPRAMVVATDISERALAVACENAAITGLAERVRFIKSDMFDGLPQDLKGSFDIVVSNPPYISESHVAGLERQVRDFEPMVALSPGPVGTKCHAMIAEEAPGWLKPGGHLVMETGDYQADEVKDILEADGRYEGITITLDINGRERVVAGRLSD